MKDAKVTVFKNLSQVDVPYIVSLKKVVKRIMSGTSKGIIERVKTKNTKSERDQIKKELPATLFASKFAYRSKKSLSSHSGLMVIDFDGFKDGDFDRMWSEIVANKHVVFCFTSPSGNGIKAVVRIPECSSVDHTRYFKKFQEEYNFDYWDDSNSDVSRVCYESYDPNAYVNWNAECFSPQLVDEGFSVSEQVPFLPINDEKVIIDKIMSFNWKKDFVEGERNNFVFDLAGAMCEYGVSENTAYAYIMNNVVIGDFHEIEVKTAVKSAYKRRSFQSKFFEDYEKRDRIKADLKKGKEKVLEIHKIDPDVYDQLKQDIEHEDFWYYEENGKGEIKIKVDPYRYKVFLETHGYKKYFPNDSQKPTWVFIDSNKVSESSPEKMKDFVLNYLLEKGYTDVWSYCASFQTLFSESYLLMLESIELMMLKDTKDESFLAFNNGILKVTKDNVELVDYIDVEGYVWKSQIINRNFKITKNTENEYKTFISNISRGKPRSIESVIGYLLHNYKNKVNNKAIILNDEVISDNPEGGTGKGVFIQGIKQVRKTSILDGKTFDDKKSFPYQTVSPETNVLVFDDVKRNWDFESKFSLVTEGMTLERKNKDAIKLSVEDSPKMVVSTNYAIRGEGNSHDRRRHEVEVAQYYGRNRTPFDEFGHQLFDDWDAEKFNRFDNYMVSCIQLYLREGLIPQQAKNLELRKFIAETSMEFHEWIQESENFQRNHKNNKSTKFDDFTNEYRDYAKWLTRKRFHAWVEKYAAFSGLHFDQGIDQGIRWFRLSDSSNPEEEEKLPF